MRLDPELWKELEQLATADLRSINGEIEYLLRDAVGRRKKRIVVAEPRRRAESGG